MKVIPRLLLGSTLCVSFSALIWCSGWGAVIWFASTRLLPEDVGFGYYADFHVALKAIEQSPCAESIEYSRHEDLTLEDCHFQIRTRSGLIVRLWFREGMDVKKVCFEPLGFAIVRPMSQTICQRYTTAGLLTILAEKGIKVSNLNDVLCSAEELALLFQSDCKNAEPYWDKESNEYLYVEIIGQQPADDFIYSRIR